MNRVEALGYPGVAVLARGGVSGEGGSNSAVGDDGGVAGSARAFGTAALAATSTSAVPLPAHALSGRVRDADRVGGSFVAPSVTSRKSR